MHEEHGLYGTAVVGERGQIVLPQEARKKFGIKPKDKLVVFGKPGRGIILVKADKMRKFAIQILKGLE